MHMPTFILVLHDDKPGHLSQLHGLTQALTARCETHLEWLPVASLSRWQWFPPADTTTRPDIIIAAGHTTHRRLLLWGRYWRSFTTVIMRPSLPLSWFDAVICPQHDKPPRSPHIFTTRIALNRMQALHGQPAQSGNHSCILLGGPSKHFDWQEHSLTAQINALIAAQPERAWHILPSRRTPASLSEKLAKACPHAIIKTPDTPLLSALQQADQAWVTPDSFSMLSEVLTLGLPCGVLSLTPHRGSRVAQGLSQLLRDGWVTPFEHWQTTQILPTRPPLDDNIQAAEWLIQRWRAHKEKS